jgi:hypothetical protein
MDRLGRLGRVGRGRGPVQLGVGRREKRFRADGFNLGPMLRFLNKFAENLANILAFLTQNTATYAEKVSITLFF